MVVVLYNISFYNGQFYNETKLYWLEYLLHTVNNKLNKFKSICGNN